LLLEWLLPEWLPLEWLLEPPPPPLANVIWPTNRLARAAKIAIILRLEVFMVVFLEKGVFYRIRGDKAPLQPLIRGGDNLLHPGADFFEILAGGSKNSVTFAAIRASMR
jgi:hypothetical protein